MGSIAEKMANYVIVTNDNPRNEKSENIIKDILMGCIKKEKILVIINRKKAILHAFYHASSDDIILIAGKGHENMQLIGNKQYYFSDQKIISYLLEKNRINVS